MKRIAAVALIGVLSSAASAQIAVEQNNVAHDLAKWLLYNVGSTLSESLHGDPQASGFYKRSGDNHYKLLGKGVVLSTGRVVDYATGPNNETGHTTDFGTSPTPAENTLLLPVTGTSTNLDVVNLFSKFQVNSLSNRIVVTLVFGSEEWPEYVGQFNDGVGVYVNGVNIALTSDDRPVNVNSVFFPSTPVTETELDNVIVVNGYPTLRFAFTPKAGINYLNLIMADANDTHLDSTVYFEQFSTACFADFNLDGGVNSSDLLQFQNAFISGSLRADIDGDGNITTNDYNLFMSHYAAGC